MSFTIHVPVFPMRKEIEARKARKPSFLFSIPGLSRPDRKRSRDADGFVAMEMLPPDELEGVRRPVARKPKGRTNA